MVLVVAQPTCAFSWPKVYSASVLSFNPVLVWKKVKGVWVDSNYYSLYILGSKHLIYNYRLRGHLLIKENYLNTFE